MKTVIRRLRRLEDRFCSSMETESSRRLGESLEAGLRRVAKARERAELSSPIYDDEEQENLAGLSVGDILDRGRAQSSESRGSKRGSEHRVWLGEPRRRDTPAINLIPIAAGFGSQRNFV